MKRMCIEDFLNKGWRFVLLRRYSTELKAVQDWFFDIKHNYPDIEFTTKGNKFYFNGKLAGHLIALSKQSNYRSGNFDKVVNLVFDEWQMVKHGQYIRYLNNECEQLLTFIDTIARLKELTDNTVIRCYCVGNSYSIVNPHFLYLGVKPDLSKRFTLKDEVCIEIIDGRGVADARKQTRFYNAIKNTPYARMAVENEFLDDNYTYIERRHKATIYLCCIKSYGEYIGVWADTKKGIIYMTQEVDLTNRNKYIFNPQDIEESFIYVKSVHENGVMKIIQNCFSKGRVKYSTIELQDIVFNAFKDIRIF